MNYRVKTNFDRGYVNAMDMGLISNTAPYVRALAWHCADGRIIR